RHLQARCRRGRPGGATLPPDVARRVRLGRHRHFPLRRAGQDRRALGRAPARPRDLGQQQHDVLIPLASMLTIAQAVSPAVIQAVRELTREYTHWAFTLEAGSEGFPTFEGLEEELASLPGVFAPPAGRLLLACFDDQPAGTIALKPHTPDL